MINQTIPIKLSEIKTIFHVGDIHIRTLKRHTEYLQVFENLRNEITKDLDGAIIYVGGDIVHAKTEMSPELIDITVKFLKMLADMAPTIVITGNHDCNLNNMNRLDAILPIIETMSHPNLFYLRESGVYRIADIDFAVFSRLGEMSDWPKANQCTADTKIALYHGTVENAVSDTGFKLSNEKVKLSRFDAFDLGLFCDIHRHQFLNKKKTIGYSSSLIQQNHGENYQNHGMLKWDVKNRTAEFIRIANDYGFVTLRIKNGIILNENELPEKPRIRLQLEDTPISDVQRIIAEVRKKYSVQDIVISNVDNSKLKNDVTGETDSIIGDINDISYQNGLIVDYISRNYNLISDDLLTEIKEINNKTNTQLPVLEITKGFTWKLKKLEFSNMFSYGEDNVIEFDSMHGVYGLFAANTAGKSSLIETLLYCLFDKCSRATRVLDIINTEKTWMSCKVQFELHGVDYFIERKGKIEYAKDVAHLPIYTNFWRIDNGVLESLNGEQRRDTNANILQYIGSYENFVLTAMSLQGDNTGLISMAQSGRKNLLASFLGLDIYEKLFNLAKEDIKEVDVILKEFKKRDLAKELADLESEINRKKSVYGKKKDILEEKQDYKDKVNEAIIIFTKELKDIANGELNLTNLNLDKSKYQREISIIELKINDNDKKIDEIKSSSIQLLADYGKYDIDDLKSRKALLATKDLERQKLVIATETLKTDLKHKSDKLEKLKSLEYDKDCKYCMNNIFVKDAIKTKEDFEVEQGKFEIINDELSTLTKLIKSMSVVNDELDEYKRMTKQIDELKTSFIKVDGEQSSLASALLLKQRYLLETNDNIKLYYENQEKIESNRDYQFKISKLEKEKTNISSEITILQSETQKLHSEIKVLENQTKNINESINQAKILEKRFRAYEIYLDCISRDGIPYELISKVVPIFETKANNILTQITDFNIMLSVDNKNIDAYIVYNENKVWSLSLTSGMEKFIASLALRVALNDISNIPKPNCLFIDEGFGNLDSDNISNMALLFNYLKTQYDFLMIVSHLDIMRDMTDNMIELKKIDGFSKVEFKD